MHNVHSVSQPVLGTRHSVFFHSMIFYNMIYYIQIKWQDYDGDGDGAERLLER